MVGKPPCLWTCYVYWKACCNKNTTPFLFPGELWDACVDRSVLAATIGASFKLFMLCGFVGWLLHSGRIPQESATVLSQVLPGDVLYTPHCFYLLPCSSASLVHVH